MYFQTHGKNKETSKREVEEGISFSGKSKQIITIVLVKNIKDFREIWYFEAPRCLTPRIVGCSAELMIQP